MLQDAQNMRLALVWFAYSVRVDDLVTNHAFGERRSLNDLD
jgi:hypothetical protein